MNFDANTIATLMQLLNPDKQVGNAENNAYNAQKTASTQSVDKSNVQNAFYVQNGIGEQVRIDFSQSKPKSPLDMLDAEQNPMLSLLKSHGGGKSDMSSMLPMLMSLMSKPSQKSAKPCDDNSQSAPTSQNGNKKDNIPSSNSENSAKGNQNAQKDAPYSDKKTIDKKTQRDVFEPVAFAGYEVVSTLAALLTAVRRPCR